MLIMPDSKTGPNYLWSEAVKAYDNKTYELSYEIFSQITEPSAYILYNIGMVAVKLGRLQDAEKEFVKAVKKDPRFSLAHFQLGSIYFTLKRYQDALKAFTSCEDSFMTESFMINYEQLGLAAHLYRCEVLHNRGILCGLTGNLRSSFELLERARELKKIPSHMTIDKTLQRLETSTDFSQFSLLNTMEANLFKPKPIPERKHKDFIKPGTVIASVIDDPDDTKNDDTSDLDSQSVPIALLMNKEDIPPIPSRPPPRYLAAGVPVPPVVFGSGLSEMSIDTKVSIPSRPPPRNITIE